MMPKLTTIAVNAIKEPGRYGDGEGLYLEVGRTGAKSWILRVTVYGKRRDIGLGGVSWVPLAEAREKARALERSQRTAAIRSRPATRPRKC